MTVERELTQEELARLLERIRRDPVWFSENVLGFEPWSKQRQVLKAVRDHPRVAVRSAHGVGKTAVAARCALWFLAAWPGSKVVTTSATWAQVREQLWRELAVAFHASGGFLRGELTDTRLELGPDWFAVGLSTDAPERFAGYHGERLLVILDEASGVNESVWEAAETLLTSPGSKLLAIGNPTRPAGAFYRAFTTERGLYKLLSISALDSPAVTGEQVPASVLARLVGPEWIEGRRQAWGEGSPLYQVRVLGEFASAADDTVCAIGDVEAAQARRLDPDLAHPVLACDVARFGRDETVIATRLGPQVRVVASYVGKDLMQTVGAIVDAARRVRDVANMSPQIVVDDVGVGGGVTDRLRELGHRVVAFQGGGKARVPDEYPNRRAEAWFELAEQLPELDLPERDEMLAADLVAPRYAFDSRGRRRLESKEETKRRLGRSPDRGDAVVMACSHRWAGESIPAEMLEQLWHPETFDLLEAQW